MQSVGVGEDGETALAPHVDLAQVPDVAQGVGHDVVEGDRAYVDAERPATGLRRGEQVVGEPLEDQGLPADRAQESLELVRGHRVAAARHDRGHAAEQRDRVADLVRRGADRLTEHGGLVAACRREDGDHDLVASRGTHHHVPRPTLAARPLAGLPTGADVGQPSHEEGLEPGRDLRQELAGRAGSDSEGLGRGVVGEAEDGVLPGTAAGVHEQEADSRQGRCPLGR